MRGSGETRSASFTARPNHWGAAATRSAAPQCHQQHFALEREPPRALGSALPPHRQGGAVCHHCPYLSNRAHRASRTSCTTATTLTCSAEEAPPRASGGHGAE